MMKSPNICLRPLLKKDVEKLNKWRNDYQIFKYLGGGYNPISKDQQESWMENMIDNTGNTKRFAIVKNETIIGMIGIYDIDYINRNGNLGMYIGEKELWGQGYGSEALNLLIEFVFKVLNLYKIKLEVVANNTGAIELYKKNGFKIVGTMKDDRYINGKYLDVHIMEILNK